MTILEWAFIVLVIIDDVWELSAKVRRPPPSSTRYMRPYLARGCSKQCCGAIPDGISRVH